MTAKRVSLEASSYAIIAETLQEGQPNNMLPIDYQPANTDNITDWCLQQFHTRYNNTGITKDDIWEYMYGVMHAPDWREQYKNELQVLPPRIPLAGSFEAFRQAGRALMDLHIGYETCPEHTQTTCLVDGVPDNGESEPETYHYKKMVWEGPEHKGHGCIAHGRTTLIVNNRCKLVGVPPETHNYKVSGRSPIEWAVAVNQNRYKAGNKGPMGDPSRWRQWQDNPFEMIRHLRRLIHVGLRSQEIIGSLPPSLPPKE